MLCAGQATAQRTGELMHRGELMFKQGLPEEASVAFQQAAELDPGNAQAIYNRGIAVLTRGDRTLAADLFRDADRAGASDELRAKARFNLGVVLFERSRETVKDSPEEAMRLLRDSARAFRGSYRLSPDERTLKNIEIVRRAEGLVAEQLELRRELNELAAEEQARRIEEQRRSREDRQPQEPDEEPLDDRIDLPEPEPEAQPDEQPEPESPETPEPGAEGAQQEGPEQEGQPAPGQPDPSGQAQRGEGEPQSQPEGAPQQGPPESAADGESPPGAMPAGPMDQPQGSPQGTPESGPPEGAPGQPQPDEPGAEQDRTGRPPQGPSELPPGPPPKPESGQRQTEGGTESAFEPQPWEQPPSGPGGEAAEDRSPRPGEASEPRPEPETGAGPEAPPEFGPEFGPETQPDTSEEMRPDPSSQETPTPEAGEPADAAPTEEETEPSGLPDIDPREFVERARELMERMQDAMERAMDSGFVVGDPEEMEEIARELRELQRQAEQTPEPPTEAEEQMLAASDPSGETDERRPDERLLEAMQELAERMRDAGEVATDAPRRDPVTDAILEQERHDRNLIREYQRRSLLGRPAQAERDW
ncbi:MAG: hypothetical protein EA423_08440 [Phycisphaerales bacterium]|nr:MAG: hypothetical protein EA423_08440 [Phycisphaerales bacterium]